MKTIKSASVVLILLMIVLSSLVTTHPAKADAPADILNSYAITITPQTDGSLVMSYVLQQYCTYSDWPSDQPYLQIGVPNANFSISGYGPIESAHPIIQAEALTSGGQFVQMDFNPGLLPKNGDCFDLNFTIVQNKMAYPDPENGNVTFKFIPAGWSFPIQVKTLTIIWNNHTDASLLKLTDPAPMETNGPAIIWQWNNPVMNSSGMFSDDTIKLAYDKSAFQLSETATTQSPDGGTPIDMQCIWTAIAVILIILLVIFIIFVASEAYSSGDGVGPAIGTVLSNTGDALDDILSSSGGGSGGSSGRSSGCACAGCACACACASGGKVGCSRKAIGVSCLAKVTKKVAMEIQE